MWAKFLSAVNWLFGPGRRDESAHLLSRWLFLRALGLILFSAFYSLAFQIRGLIGPDGILPAGEYLRRLHEQAGALAYWYAPTLLWLGSGFFALKLLWIAGLVASICLVFNLWPRAALVVCLVAYLSFVSAAQDFSSYQSDGMLLSAGFISYFFAPPGLRPRLGEEHPPSRASLFLLVWLCFNIYFESGFVKLASHDVQWRTLTAMDHYYENGPLPNWIGWYAQQLPHGFHAATALATLMVELGLVWVFFLRRRLRIVCFFIVTLFQIGIILTANLAFLNHLVLSLGVLLLDDRFLNAALEKLGLETYVHPTGSETLLGRVRSRLEQAVAVKLGTETFRRLLLAARHLSLFFAALMLSWVFYVMTALMTFMFFRWAPLPVAPIVALQPFRIASQYGLFAVMTTARYEIEFQGTRDGKNWVAYPFRYKPQDPREPPGFYAPYQPRFDWNLWFASLGHWRAYFFVVRTEVQLLHNSPGVLSLFAANPFRDAPPERVRAVLWQYWFTDLETKRREGLWWRRELRGLYAPALELGPNGEAVVVEWPESDLTSLTPEE